MKMKKNIFFFLFFFFMALFLRLLSSSSISVPVLLNPPLPDHHHHYSPPPPSVVGCGKADHLSSSVFCWAWELCAASLLRQPKTGDWKATIKNNFCCVDPSSSASLLQPISAFRRSKATRKLLLLLIPTDSSVSLERGGGGGGGGGGGRRLQEKQNYHADFSTHSKKVAIAVSAAFLLCCALLCPCFRSKKKEPLEQPVSELISSKDFTSSSIHESTNSETTLVTLPQPPPSPLRVPPSPPRFSMSPRLNRVGSIHLNVNQITKATQNFSQSHVIGEGGFGTVYKAELPDGQVVAIKRARKEHFQALRTEFSSEVELLAKIEHRSLVRLLGYINNGNERIIISEYIPNGTLREHLDCQHGKILDFSQRLEIAIDVAHALTYLHLYAEKPIIHRDVKSTNILLTESFRAKVSDFGFARVVGTDGQSHVLTKVKGTAGYLDPEYLRTHQLTPKSDVFSFGILLLEILSGRRPVELKRDVDERITIRWAFKKYTQGRMRDILDPLLEEVIHGEVLIRMLGLAFECAAPTRADRPAMKQVVETLWEIRKEYGRNLGENRT